MSPIAIVCVAALGVLALPKLKVIGNKLREMNNSRNGCGILAMVSACVGVLSFTATIALANREPYSHTFYPYITGAMIGLSVINLIFFAIGTETNNSKNP